MMFSIQDMKEDTENSSSKISPVSMTMKKNKTPPNIYTQMNHENGSNHCPISNMSSILEQLVTEKQKNKTETWNKLNKTIKIQKLYVFADKYGKEHDLSTKDVRLLKSFLVDSLEKGKLQKVKDVLCDKETRDITSIPSLVFNLNSHNFTLRSTDTKRVSTLKSLPPKRPTLVVESTELVEPNEKGEKERV